MPLKTKIENDLREAMKAKAESRTGTLRLVLAAVHNREIEKRGKGQENVLTEEEITDLLRNEAKKRKESFEIYSQNGRGDLAEREKAELAIIEAYLPAEMSESELQAVVEDVFAKLGPSGPGGFGRIMGEVMRRVRGMVDASRVQDAVKRRMTRIDDGK